MKKKNDSRGNERYMTKVIYQKNLHTYLDALSCLLFHKIWYDTKYHYQLGDVCSFGFWALTRKVFSAWGRRVETFWLLAIFENFTHVSLLWTNNNLLLSQTKFISSKHTCSPTTPVNIRIASHTVLYLWHNKIDKNLIFW